MAGSLRTFLVADSIGLLIVVAFGLVIFFVLRPRRKSQA
jgi:cbb3-type cytochrome oxidase subunit 3